MSAATISTLLDDIRDLEAMVLHCQNQIFHKHIAIQKELNAALVSASVDGHVSVRQMIMNLLPEFDGRLFRHTDITAHLVKRFPEHEEKIRRNVYQVVQQLRDDGQIIKTDAGLKRST